jgi:hypothetical protein
MKQLKPTKYKLHIRNSASGGVVWHIIDPFSGASVYSSTAPNRGQVRELYDVKRRELLGLPPKTEKKPRSPRQKILRVYEIRYNVVNDYTIIPKFVKTRARAVVAELLNMPFVGEMVITAKQVSSTDAAYLKDAIARV